MWPKFGYTWCLCGQNRVPFQCWPGPQDSHLIGQRRPPPDDGQISAGWTRFWTLNSQRVPDSCTQLPENGRAVRLHRPNGPPRTNFHPSSSLCYRRRRARTICLISMIWFARPQTTASSLPLSNRKSHLTPQHSALSLLPTKIHLSTAAGHRDRL